MGRGNLLLVIFGSMMVIGSSKVEDVKLDNNGYTGLTVVISDNVPEDLAIVDNLQTAFTEASKLLYKASKYFVYFKDVTIVVPKSWSNIGQYQRVTLTKAGQFVVEVSDISNPFVFGQTECGGTGKYVQFPPEVALTSRSLGYGALEKVLVHEWGHLRWGLFDEYPGSYIPGVDVIENFYNEGGTWKPTICNDQVMGKNLRDCSNEKSRCFSDPDTGKPDEDCKFCITNPNIGKASLMGYQWVDSIVEFCDSDDDDVASLLRHNSRAPTRQNRLCGQRSAWEVMRGNPDFKSPNVVGNINKDTKPTFNVVQEGDIRVVLLLDTSGSMKVTTLGPTRIQLLADSVTHFLLYVVPDGAEVGIVSFSGIAKVQKEMTKITSQAIREELVQKIPTVPSGATSIGAGIQTSLQTLNATSTNLKDAIIILVSDGVENRRPLIADVLPELESSGAIVHTLGIGSQSDTKLKLVAESTGGKSFYYSESTTSTVLQDAFINSMPQTLSLINVDSKAFVSPAGSPIDGEFYIDSSIGSNTVVQVTVNDSSSLDIVVTGPDGQTYTPSDITKNNTCYRAIVIPGQAKVGKYVYRITSNTHIQSVVSIQTKPRDSNSRGLVVSSWTSITDFSYAASATAKIFATVQQDSVPVINAQIKALLENEDGNTVEVELKDSGVGSDLLKDDGMYSAYILPKHVKKDGRINAKISVDNSNGSAKKVTITKSGSATQNAQGGVATSVVDNFQRVSQAGEIFVSNYTTSPLPDQLPPSKITTLALALVDVDRGVFKVTWRAVGDDYDDGKASEYDVRLSSNFTQIKEAFDSAVKLSNNIPTPKLPGEGESFDVTLSAGSGQQTFYLALRAIDDSGNKADVSNILPLSIITDSVWGTTTTAAPTTTTSPTTTTITRVVRGDYSTDSELIIGLAASITAIVICIAAIVMILSCIYKRKKSSSLRKNKLHYYDGKQYRTRPFEFNRFDGQRGIILKPILPRRGMSYQNRPVTKPKGRRSKSTSDMGKDTSFNHSDHSYYYPV